MRDTLLLNIFQGAMAHIPGREINGLTVKQDGIALPNPTRTAGEKWTAYCVSTGHLVTEICGTATFRSAKRALLLGEGKEEI